MNVKQAKVALDDELNQAHLVGRRRAAIWDAVDQLSWARTRMALTSGIVSPLLDVREEEDHSWSVSIRAMPGHVGAAEQLEMAFVEAADAAESWVGALRDRVPDLRGAAEGAKPHVPRVRITTPTTSPQRPETLNVLTRILLDGEQWYVLGYQVDGKDTHDLQKLTLTFLADVTIEHGP